MMKRLTTILFAFLCLAVLPTARAANDLRKAAPESPSVTFIPSDYAEQEGDITLSKTDADGNQVSLNFRGIIIPIDDEDPESKIFVIGESVTLTSIVPIVKVVVSVINDDGDFPCHADCLSGEGYSAQGNIGTWTGLAFSVSLINNIEDGFLGINKIEVFLDNTTSLILSREDFDFGTVKLGTKRTLPLIITALQDIRLLSADLPEKFSLAETLPLDLVKGSKTTLHLTFSPEETGTYDGALKLDFGDSEYTLPISAQCEEVVPIESILNKELPAQNAFYDFHAEGSKGFIYTSSSVDMWGYVEKGKTILTSSQANGFVDEPPFSEGFLDRLDYVEDINRDGYPDFCQYNCYAPPRNAICRMMLSNADGSYTYIPNAWFLPHLDLNQDGKTDYLSYILDEYWSPHRGKTELVLHLSTPAGTYTETRLALLSSEDYYTSFDPDAWYEEGPFMGDSWGVNAMPGICPDVFTAVALPDRGPQEDPILYRLPTRVVDLNGDGRPDLVDETNGYIFYNMSDSRWILGYTGGYTKVVDFNGDGYSDLAVNKNGNLIYYKYIGNGDFRESTLYENLAVDDHFYVQDLNGDGFQDLLVTISHSKTGSAAYIVPFLNDGAGNLTQQPEFYTDKPYEFGHLQDIDGDGILDMLAWELEEGINHTEGFISGKRPYVVFLKGKRGGSFEAGVRILDLGTDINAEPSNYAYYDFRDVMHLNAADIDNDGIMEVWASGVEKDMTHIYKVEGAPALTAPQKPASPVLSYDRSSLSLRVDWAAGSDTYSSPCDLTYALRIGTTPGGDDILPANALADGTRRDFGRGNQEEQRSTLFDVSAWAPGTYYVSLQAINNRHMGSAWSEPASFTHEALPGFQLDKSQMTIVDTLTVYFTPLPDTYASVWDFDDGEVVSEGKGYKKIVFATYGEKELRLSLTSPEGKSASFRQKTDVLPNYFSFADTVEDNYYYRAYLDCNNDGYLDVVKSDGVYLNDGTGRFSKPVALWNTGLNLSGVTILDYDRDGYADILYKGDGISDGYLRNNGNGTFTKKTDAAVSSLVTGSHYSNRPDRVWDFDGDGIKDGLTVNGSSLTSFSKWHADGSQSTIEATCPNGIREEPQGYSNYGYYFVSLVSSMRVKDLNGDGLPDLYDTDYEGDYPNQKYKGVWLYLNEGGFAFSEHFLPFASPIANEDFGGGRWVDMNADGFLDIVSYRSSDNGKAFYILYNEENRGFSAPAFVSLPTGIEQYSGYIFFYDMDNNGYVDALFNAHDENNKSGLHIVYFGEDGVLKQRFDADGAGVNLGKFLVDLDADGIVDIGPNAYHVGLTPLLKSAASNERPSAPAGLQAELTDKGLLISWEPARDDRTPYAAMRYNISVKRKGQTGEGAYILSPLNGGDATTAIQPTHLSKSWGWNSENSEIDPYLRGSSCLIASSALTTGEELEISVQAIDLWGMAGAFSETLLYQVGSHAKISAAATACTGYATEISYLGTATTATPEWDFDGGVAEGSGFGPYSVHWNEAGTKRVSLRVGDEECYVTIKVNENPSAWFSIPGYIQYNVPTAIGLPEVSPKAAFTWRMAFDGDFLKESVTSQYVRIEAKPSYRYGSVRFHNHPEIKTRRLGLTVTLDGCMSYHETPTLHLLGEEDRPEISYVAPDASGHYTVYWKGGGLPEGATGVMVQKESSYSGEFDDMEVMGLNAGSYTDLQSDAAVKSERYRLKLMFGGEEGPYSESHKGVHLSINRGMQEGQYNLIWSAYEGRRLATYRILRGSDPDNMSLLASLSAGNTFYSDLNAGTGDVYYAIEYELYNETYFPLSAAKNAPKAGDRYTGRSNTVGSANSRSIVAAQSMNVLSVTGMDRTTSDNPYLYLYAEIFPASATYRTVTWSLSAGDEALASINQNGRLQAKLGNPGGYVTVRAVTIDGSNISATRQIYIEPYSDEPGGGDDPGNDDPVQVTGVSLDHSSIGMSVAQALRLNATVSPTNATDKTVSWYSSDESVATVDATGLVRAVSEGEADITVITADGGYEATCHVTVSEGEGPGEDQVSVTGVSLTPASVTLEVSQTGRLSATVSPSNATNKSVLWYSTNADVVSVDGEGLLFAVSAGGADIIVTTVDGGYEATCHVTVKAGEGPGGGDPVSVTGVSLAPTSVTLEVSQTGRLNATVSPANATNKTVSWRSSNTSVATVDATGLVRAVAAGGADITVTTADGGYEATCRVTVKNGNPTATADVTLAGVNVYPNPSAGLFNVETPCPTQASVYTEQGRMLHTYRWPAAGRYEVDLRHRPSGIYFLRLRTPQGEKTLKLVVE